jgi:pimeloyl-ACP methyl ester carboxylesterase
MSRALAGAAALCIVAAPVNANDFAATDLFLPHVSTLAMNAGAVIPLHLHRKVATNTATGQVSTADRAVLFVHGGTTPTVAAFGLEHKDYNWMAFLARAGFDVWGVDLTGYGASARPMMDDPCNVNPEHQNILLKRPLAAPCPAHYPFRFKTVKDDWAEIDTAVDHIRRVTGVAKVSIVAWSAGVSRAGGYAALNQDKINRIVFYAPGGVRPGFKAPEHPGAGFPVILQTRVALEGKRGTRMCAAPGRSNRACATRFGNRSCAGTRSARAGGRRKG